MAELRWKLKKKKNEEEKKKLDKIRDKTKWFVENERSQIEAFQLKQFAE